MKAPQALLICCCALMVCLTAIYCADQLTRSPRERASAVGASHGATPSPDTPRLGGESAAPPLLRDAPWGVGVAPTMTKVFCDEAFTGPAARGVEIALARHEIEGIQLVVAAQTQELRDVAVAISPLQAEGHALPAADVTWSLVGYVETKGERPYWTDKVGLWPDPLLKPQRFSVARGKVQPIWLNVYAPPETPSGLYRGSVTIAPANAEAWRVELSVRVWGFTLPRAGHLKTMCWMDPRAILRFHGLASVEAPGAVDLVKRYAALALRNRLAPGGSIGCGFSWAKPQWPVRETASGYDFSQAEEMLRFCFDRGMNCFLMAIIPNLKRTGWPGYSKQWKTDFTGLVANYSRFLREKGYLQHAYVYNFDEAPKACWDIVKENYRMVKAADPGLRVMQCLNEPEGVRALAGFADTWDTYVQQYQRTGVAERQEAGDEAWWAVCLYPKERPNFFIDYPAIDERIIGWLSWKYGISGFEYWSIVSWGEENTIGEDGRKWPAVPWKTKKFAGDGYLCYPGPDGEPLSSVRFENLRDGFEDYEYLWLLREALPRLGEADGAAARKLLTIDAPLAASNAVYTDDPAVILQRRAAISRMLEKHHLAEQAQ